MKRVVSVLLLVCMLVSLMGMGTAAYAEELADGAAVVEQTGDVPVSNPVSAPTPTGAYRAMTACSTRGIFNDLLYLSYIYIVCFKRRGSGAFAISRAVDEMRVKFVTVRPDRKSVV